MSVPPFLYSTFQDNYTYDNDKWQRGIRDFRLNAATSRLFVYSVAVRRADLPAEVIQDLRVVLRHYAIDLWHGQVTCLEAQMEEEEEEDDEDLSALSFPVRYALLCLQSSCSPFLPLGFPTTETLHYIKSIPEQDDAVSIIHTLRSILSLPSATLLPASSPLFLLQQTYGAISLTEKQINQLLKTTPPSWYALSPPPDCLYMPRVTVTPTRVLYHEAKPICGNRITRHMGKGAQEDLVLVEFVEEDRKKLWGGAPIVNERIQGILLR